MQSITASGQVHTRASRKYGPERIAAGTNTSATKGQVIGYKEVSLKTYDVLHAQGGLLLRWGIRASSARSQ